MRFPILALAACALAACSHPGGKALDERVAQQTQVAGPADLRAETDRLIDTEPGLTPTQREKLRALRASLSPKIDAIARSELRLRSVLVEEVLSPGYDPGEVALIKKRLRKLEDQRLSLLFQGVDDANGILGYEGARHVPMMRAMLNTRSEGAALGRE